MPPRTKTTPNIADDRPRPCPRTRSKNADTHPGLAAQDTLRVNAPRRAPEVIQQEKDAANEKKTMKIQAKEAIRVQNEATRSIADEFRARQVSEQINAEAEMPRKKLKGRVTIKQYLA